MKMQVIVSGMMLMAAFVSCHPKSEFEISKETLRNIPDSVLEVEQMIGIMTDIHLAEAWVIEDNRDSLSKDDQLKEYYAEIFLNHGISAEMYKRSYNYYVADPVLMNYIYQEVTEKLNLLESQNRTANQSKNTSKKNE